MSVPCKSERSLLSHDEYETVRVTHHPAIYELDGKELEAVRHRLRTMRDKEGTLARQKRREARGKAGPRGGSFPGTAERPARRKQVFGAALKRINKEAHRLRSLEARVAHVDAAHRALAQRAEKFIHHPAAGDAAHQGMKPLSSTRRRTKVSPAKIGSVSQATKVAQARRDARN
ncbi:MAG: hypothetical protein JO255_11210 [Alphaproteobacteria bacterium]|nr:hypothetical protein [Alphaproteobacteria bacterium]